MADLLNVRVADIDLWPISTLPVADMVFYVADMVVADIDVIQATEHSSSMTKQPKAGGYGPDSGHYPARSQQPVNEYEVYNTRLPQISYQITVEKLSVYKASSNKMRLSPIAYWPPR